MTERESFSPPTDRCWIVTRGSSDHRPIRVLAVCTTPGRAAAVRTGGLRRDTDARADDDWYVHSWPLDILVSARARADRDAADSDAVAAAIPGGEGAGSGDVPHEPDAAAGEVGNKVRRDVGAAPARAAGPMSPDDAALARVACRAALADVEGLFDVAAASPGGPLDAVGEAFHLREGLWRRVDEQGRGGTVLVEDRNAGTRTELLQW